MTDEEYRAHQEMVRGLREKKGHLVRLRREGQKALLDLRGHITTALTPSAIQPHTNSTNLTELMTSLVLVEVRILEIDNLLDAMVDDLFELIDELV